MSRKQVVFLLLVTVGLVVSRFDDCDVEANQTIAIQTCTLAPQNVPKVNGYCPTSDYVLPIAVCEDVDIKVCHEVATRDLETNCITFSTPHCVTSYEKHSGGVEVRRRSVDGSCEVKKATCVDGGVVAPKNVTCN